VKRGLIATHRVSERHAEAAPDPDNSVNLADVLLVPDIMRPFMPN